MILRNKIAAILSLVLSLGMVSAQAALVNYEITGTVTIGDETAPNLFNLTAGDTITASGVFDDSILGTGENTISFDGVTTTLSIDVNGTVYTQDDDPFASMTFIDGALSDFDFYGSEFNSFFTNFDDYGSLLGEWSSDVQISAVPVPAAIWLFGMGLMTLAGFAKRK